MVEPVGMGWAYVVAPKGIDAPPATAATALGSKVSAGLLENAVADHFPNRTRDEIISQRIRQLVDRVVYDPATGGVEVEWRRQDD